MNKKDDRMVEGGTQDSTKPWLVSGVSILEEKGKRDGLSIGSYVKEIGRGLSKR